MGSARFSGGRFAYGALAFSATIFSRMNSEVVNSLFLTGPPMNLHDEYSLERYRPLLRIQARQLRLHTRLRRRFDSSDLVQETFVRALKGLDGFRGTGELELVKWLQKILANVAVDRIREEEAQKCDPALEQSIHAAVGESSACWSAILADPEATPSRQAEQRELLLRLANAIEQLPGDQRDVVVLRDLSGATIAEIAGRLGKTKKAIAGLLLRGRQRLRELLPEES
jgi:RNA polymerase sigma-70 factor, ECF subfamily